MKKLSPKALATLVAAVALSALAVFAFAGCGQNSNSGSSASNAGSSQSAGSDKQGDTVGTVTTDIDMSSYGAGKSVRVWVPVAQDYEYQKVTDVAYDAPGAKTAEITEDSAGNKALYLEWDKDAKPEERKATLSFKADRELVSRPELLEKDGELPSDVAEYLKGSRLVPVNDQVKDAANKIVEGKTSDLDKARAIYDWIVQNMTRDESVEGCGQGDVCALLTTQSGKCTDINSVFVGLCRAVDIPAREMFGVRMNADDITGNQHCWAEFYLNGTGWVSADPADVLKAVLKGGWTKDQQETKDKAEYYWGGLDSQRVQLSAGRDITLSPAQNDEALNYFGYPYGEVDGSALDFYDPENFSYRISFTAE